MRSFGMCVLLFVATADVSAEKIHALLIGVTDYYYLPDHTRLRGPAYDVQSLESLLAQYPASKDNVVVLAENQLIEFRPTRANIVREYENLAKRVHAGDQVVILHSGHGSQDIDDDPENENDREIDGMDELFLPADTREWNETSGRIQGAIRDDEIGRWLESIRQKGASVLFIGDSCHSDTQTRGDRVGEGSTEQPQSRGISLLPQHVRNSVATTPTQTRLDNLKTQGQNESVGDTGMVAIYAARSHETTPDRFRDPETHDYVDAGLLAFTICNILQTTTRPITYRELTQRIRHRYVGYHQNPIGADVPTPTFEGSDLDRIVLKSDRRPGRSSIRYYLRGRQLYLSCSRMDGILPGSVLRLYPQAGEAASDQLCGWAVVKSSNFDDSLATVVTEKPSPAGWKPRTDLTDLPPRGRCEVESVAFGENKLAIALDDSASPLKEVLNELSGRPQSYLEIDETQPAALRLLVSKNAAEETDLRHVKLERTTTFRGKPIISRFDLGPIDDSAKDRLDNALQKIVRVMALRACAQEIEEGMVGSDDLRVTVEIISKLDSQQRGDLVRTIQVGDEISFRFVNQSSQAVNIYPFYVSDDYGVSLIESASVSLAAAGRGHSSELTTKTSYRVKLPSRAVENLIVFLTPESKGRVSREFRFLKQSPLVTQWNDQSSRGNDQLGASKVPHPASSRLEKLLALSFFRPGGARSRYRRNAFPPISIASISWFAVEK